MLIIKIFISSSMISLSGGLRFCFTLILFCYGQNLATGWMHGGDPVDALQINKHIEKFKSCVASNPKFLQEKVKEYFKVVVPNCAFVRKRSDP